MKHKRYIPGVTIWSDVYLQFRYKMPKAYCEIHKCYELDRPLALRTFISWYLKAPRNTLIGWWRTRLLEKEFTKLLQELDEKSLR